MRPVTAMILLLVVVALVPASLAFAAVLGGTRAPMPAHTPPLRPFDPEPERTAA
jgi:hypothetical protein